MPSKPITLIRVIVFSFTSALISFLFISSAWAINNAPADATVVNVRTNCTEGGVEVINCFTTMANVQNWLTNVRQTSPALPTLVQIGPGRFVSSLTCGYSNVTLRGAGRDQTILDATNKLTGMQIYGNCTALDVQELTIDASQAIVWAIFFNPGSDWAGITTWTNVDIIGPGYGWTEATQGCTQHGQNFFFNSRISTVGAGAGGISRTYQAACAVSWFYGSQITSNASPGVTNAFALQAVDAAEVHFYGSNVRMILAPGTSATPYGGGDTGDYLMAALQGSVIHIHGTGLDVNHGGSGTADVLYADSTSHFHANASGFSIHATGSGTVNRIDGAGVVEAPYIWGASTTPPLSTSPSGVQTLASRNGMDSFIETNCPLSSAAACSAGANLPAVSQYPRLMVYRAECTGIGANQGPWFDTVQGSCRN
jgi:hypothetical protein